MASKAHSIELKLLGQKIALKSSGDPEIVNEVVSLVTGKIKDAESRSKSSVAHHVALLALLDLAEEYAKAKRRAITHKKEIDDKSRQIFELIETELR